MKGLIDYLKKIKTLSFGYVKENEVWKRCWNDYSEIQMKSLDEMEIRQAIDYLVSNLNYLMRYNASGCEEFNVDIKVGDVCYIDFGCAYKYEIGYQHFGLILSICTNKVCVVPMSGSEIQYYRAYDKIDNPMGNNKLMRFKKLKGMKKNTVLYLSDVKWINSARIIDVKAHLSTESDLFLEIKKRAKDLI